MKKTISFLITAIAFQAAIAAGMSTNEAFDTGQTFGKDNINGVKGQINSTKASDSVPNYTSTDPASSYYQGGKGSLTAPASGQVTGCTSTSGSSDQDAFTHGKCESVRMIMNDPGKKAALYPINKNTDPLMTERNTVRDGADTYLGSSTPTGNYSGCSEKTTTSPDQYITESCNEWPQNTTSQQSCFKTALVTASMTTTLIANCEQGTWMKMPYTPMTQDGASQLREIWLYCDNSRADDVILKLYTSTFGWFNDVPIGVGNFAPPYPKTTGQIVQVLSKGVYFSYRVNACDAETCSFVPIIYVGKYIEGAPMTMSRPGYQSTTTTKIDVAWDNGCAALESQVQP